VVAVLDGLDIERAHLVGVSMGAAAALQVCLKHPERVRSATLASIGTGSDAKPGEMQAGMEAMARMIESQGLENLALSMGNQPARRKLKDKHPAQFAKFTEEVRALSSQGMANTMRGVQKRRPPVYAHEAQLSVARMPILVVLGGDDAACKGPSEFLAKQLPAAQLEVFPGTGHLVNIEEAGRFNELVLGLVGNVDGIG
jgi:pimeloyl-ACP methyl ester carboxylesterase